MEKHQVCFQEEEASTIARKHIFDWTGDCGTESQKYMQSYPLFKKVHKNCETGALFDILDCYWATSQWLVRERRLLFLQTGQTPTSGCASKWGTWKLVGLPGKTTHIIPSPNNRWKKLGLFQPPGNGSNESMEWFCRMPGSNMRFLRSKTGTTMSPLLTHE